MTLAVGDLENGSYETKNNKGKINFCVQWNIEMFPYVWMRYLYGGANHYPWFERAYTLALEPWSSIPGNLNQAIDNRTAIRIKGHKIIETQLKRT